MRALYRKYQVVFAAICLFIFVPFIYSISTSPTSGLYNASVLLVLVLIMIRLLSNIKHKE